MDETTDEIEGVYPIRTVSEVTGINAVTLRAWERRYGLINPQRTTTGHRLYTDEHIDEIRRIVSLMQRGVSIGQVKRVLGSCEKPPRVIRASTAQPDAWQGYRQQMLRAIARFDESGMEAVYNDVLSLYPVDLVTRYLVAPLLDEMRERRRGQPAGEAEICFFKTYLGNKLGARFHHQSGQARGPRVMGACLPGETSAVELLLFGLSAMTHGYRMILLGANVALDALPLALERSVSRALLLSGNVELPATLLNTLLPALVKETPVPVFMSGRTAIDHTRALEQIGIIPLLGETQSALCQMDEELSVRRAD